MRPNRRRSEVGGPGRLFLMRGDYFNVQTWIVLVTGAVVLLKLLLMLPDIAMVAAYIGMGVGLVKGLRQVEKHGVVKTYLLMMRQVRLLTPMEAKEVREIHQIEEPEVEFISGA